MLTIYQQKYKGQGEKGKNMSYAVPGWSAGKKVFCFKPFTVTRKSKKRTRVVSQDA